MEFQFMVGVDMGKTTFAYCVLDKQLRVLLEGQIDNHAAQIEHFCSYLKQALPIDSISQLFLCLEHTGSYSKPLIRHWVSCSGRFDMVAAAQVSQLLTGSLGWSDKNDAIDARRIAEYGIRFKDKLQPKQLDDASLEALQFFQRQRERLKQAYNLIKVSIQEAKGFHRDQIVQHAERIQQQSLQQLKKAIKAVELQLTTIIDQDPQLAQWFQLMISVEGVGPVTAREILIATNGFTKFQPHQAKKFARYAGVVPLEWSSGSTLKRRPKTTKKANRKLKPLLTMGATSLVDKPSQLGQYYRRKVAEGKHHCSIINAMRNKIILRVFAVVRNQTMYQQNLNLNLVSP
ncbi:MAG: IS110 family transposase [Bacteroidota bacterium]